MRVEISIERKEGQGRRGPTREDVLTAGQTLESRWTTASTSILHGIGGIEVGRGLPAPTEDMMTVSTTVIETRAGVTEIMSVVVDK